MVILSIQEKVHMLITEYFSMKISLERDHKLHLLNASKKIKECKNV